MSETLPCWKFRYSLREILDEILSRSRGWRGAAAIASELAATVGHSNRSQTRQGLLGYRSQLLVGRNIASQKNSNIILPRPIFPEPAVL